MHIYTYMLTHTIWLSRHKESLSQRIPAPGTTPDPRPWVHSSHYKWIFLAIFYTGSNTHLSRMNPKAMNYSVISTWLLLDSWIYLKNFPLCHIYTSIAIPIMFARYDPASQTTTERVNEMGIYTFSFLPMNLKKNIDTGTSGRLVYHGHYGLWCQNILYWNPGSVVYFSASYLILKVWVDAFVK